MNLISLNTGLYTFTDQNGYMRLSIEKNKSKSSPVATFSSQKEACEFLYNAIEKFTLCQKLCGLYKSENACFHYGQFSYLKLTVSFYP